MAREIYSVRFGFASIPSGPFADQSLYVVPTGFVAVVRDIRVTVYGATGTPGDVYVNVAGGGQYDLVLIDSTWLEGTRVFVGRTVLNDGDDLRIDMNAGRAVDAVVSGYLLTA